MDIVPHGFLGWLDRAGFWDIQVWDFSFRSLTREYAWLFLRKAVLAHPVRTATGLRRYRRFVRGRQGQPAAYASLMMIPDEMIFVQDMRTAGARPLIGLGFCLKPIDPGSSLRSCPSGRANHDCLFLERGETRPACAGCAILTISRLALEKGCPVYIMTSAKDIARDFMFPQIKRSLFPSAILLLCPYSVQAIIPPLLICAVNALLIPYARGSCADYEQWLKADKGIKDERTELSPDANQNVHAVLGALSTGPPRRRRFQRQDNVFFPR